MCCAYKPPSSAMETTVAPATIRWSSSLMSTSARACFSCWVKPRSAALASASPDGWLWATISAAAWWRRASRTTSRG
ncbi:hypothetical protein G6F53_014296 [Rhizopus delemar]|nr:hypothetical protein G6F53_014296 [Rhizopus delemar]